MLLAALPIRSAPARIVTRTARSLSSSPLRSPLSDRQQPYRLCAAATAAGSDTATMPGIRTVKQVGLYLGSGSELETVMDGHSSAADAPLCGALPDEGLVQVSGCITTTCSRQPITSIC